MDFQHRGGSRPGAGAPLSEQQAGAVRRERLRKLAMETIDLSKDPYFVRNHHGTYECKLCSTLHKTEGNYLAHTQGIWVMYKRWYNPAHHCREATSN